MCALALCKRARACARTHVRTLEQADVCSTCVCLFVCLCVCLGVRQTYRQNLFVARLLNVPVQASVSQGWI